MNRKHFSLTGLVIISLATLVSCGAIQVKANNSIAPKSISSVFGGISVDDGAKVKDLSSVNGGIDVGSNVTADSIDTVNGGIELGDNVSIKSAATVNGSIIAGKSFAVEHSLETVNGKVVLDESSLVAGNIQTVNGDVELKQVLVKGNLETTNGDVSLSNKSILEGDLIIQKSGSWLFDSEGHGQKVTINIDASSIVNGKIHLYKPVQLNINEAAKVGEIIKHYSQK